MDPPTHCMCERHVGSQHSCMESASSIHECWRSPSASYFRIFLPVLTVYIPDFAHMPRHADISNRVALYLNSFIIILD